MYFPFDRICYAFATGQCFHSFRQIWLPRYLMNGLSNLDETYRQYSLVSADDLIRFWRWKVKVTAGRRRACLYFPVLIKNWCNYIFQVYNWKWEVVAQNA